MSIDTVVEIEAKELPEKLRGTIDPTHTVRVTVVDLGAPAEREERRAYLLAQLDALDRQPEGGPSLDDAVARVRALRDEWD